MDTLHTNEERINKIRCLFDTIYTHSDDMSYAHRESIIIDLAAATECLDALEDWINNRSGLDCI